MRPPQPGKGERGKRWGCLLTNWTQYFAPPLGSDLGKILIPQYKFAK